MTPTFNITAYRNRRGFLERQIAVMQSHPEENSTMEIPHTTEISGKHSTDCAAVIFAEWSYYLAYQSQICTQKLTLHYTYQHRTTSRKVAGSIPDGIIRIFHLPNPSGPTMALGLTQPLT